MSISLTRTINVTAATTNSSTTYASTASSGSHSGVSVTTVTIGGTSSKALKYSSYAAITGYLTISSISVSNTTVTVKGSVGLYINSTWGPSSTATISVSGTGQTTISETKKPSASGATYQQYGSSFSWSWSRAASASTKVITASTSFSSSSWYSGDTCKITYNLTIPALPTYSITYNGNGNTGESTSAQTKTYGTAITLRSNGFTRTNYAFTKWNTAANGSGTSYNAGASYTGNAALTLYAQWQSTYTKPTITNLKAYRVETSGSSTAAPEGEYIYITFTYARGKNGTTYISSGNTQSVTVSNSLTITSSHSWSNTTGTYTGWASNADKANSYTVTVTLRDDQGSITTSITVGAATYPITINENTIDYGNDTFNKMDVSFLPGDIVPSFATKAINNSAPKKEEDDVSFM